MRLDSKKNIKRLVIYFFYDGDGIVDRYVPYLLEDMKKNCTEIFVVVNGKLTPEGRDTFKTITPHILVRDNVGFDVWAYKEALETYGWKKLSEFDEVILMNHTIMGPVYPFSEMFSEMDKRDLDFWGLTKYHKVSYDPFETIYGHIPEHIQSHFIVVRNEMLKSREFQKYWEKRPKIESYKDAVGKHEAIFTKYFNDKGFKWDVYIDTSDMEDYTMYPIMYAPHKLVADYRCPIFKRRSFFNNHTDLISYTNGDVARKLYEYLRDNTDYDVGMIWENILRDYDMADIKNSMSLDYIVSATHSVAPAKKHKLALIIHSYFEDLVEYCYKYALSMPSDCDIYVTTDTEKKKEAVEKQFSKGPWKNVKVILIENRGRDVSALLVGAAEYVDNYDYVCFVHDKKVTQLDYGVKGETFSERCFQNVLGSEHVVNNIIELFEKEPYLGLLCPPPPIHAEYYSTLGCEWGISYEVTEKMHKKLELKSPLNINKEPIAPLGTMFWFRPDALKKLLDRGWKYSDFPKEPNNTDGTMLHAIERIYPYVAQDAGYYTAWVLNDDNARTEWNNLAYMLRSVNTRVFNLYGVNSHYGLITTLDNCISQNAAPGGNSMTVPQNLLEHNLRMQKKQKMKNKCPKPLWNFMRKVYHFFGGKKWVG